MDFDTIIASVRRTGRLVVAEESPVTGSVGAEIIVRTVEAIDRPIRAVRVAMPDMIHPYSASMEREILPDAELIIDAVRSLLAGTRTSACVKHPLRATQTVGLSPGPWQREAL